MREKGKKVVVTSEARQTRDALMWLPPVEAFTHALGSAIKAFSLSRVREHALS
jgi:hypothetical protein